MITAVSKMLILGIITGFIGFHICFDVFNITRVEYVDEHTSMFMGAIIGLIYGMVEYYGQK